MRALILVAAAALAVTACAKNEAAENTMNVDEAVATETNDMTAVDAATATDANLVADENMVDANVVDANATTEANAM